MSAPKLSLLDRSIVFLLKDPDDTASRRDGIPAADERLHRAHGVSLLFDASALLKVPLSCTATAATILHRFYHSASLLKHDIWSIAMGSLVLAMKTEEVPLDLRDVIVVFIHVFRRRYLIVVDNEEVYQVVARCMGSNAFAQQKLAVEEKVELLKKLPPTSQVGPIWKDWFTAVNEAENLILRSLGFILYWIPQQHPHRYLHYALDLLLKDVGDEASRDVRLSAWRHCNDSLFLNLACQYPSPMIACACIWVAAMENKVGSLARSIDWWSLFVAPDEQASVSAVANALLAWSEGKDDNIRWACYGFVPSLVKPDGSFNDPSSFVAVMLREAMGSV